MYKIAVIGDSYSIIGFKTAGFDVYPVKDGEEAGEVLKKIVNKNYGVIYITEDMASKNMSNINTYIEDTLQAIILIPGTSGSLGLGIAGVKKSVERAVGADILFKDK
jgi:V/A-type H+-transporting ATPase subunit F